MLEHDIPQPGPDPQLVDHGQDRQRAGARGALFPGSRDKGCVYLSEDPAPLTRILHLLQQLGQPIRGLSGSDHRSYKPHPSSPMQEGDMARRRLRNSSPVSL